jgi:hypothetical protein
MQVMQVIKKQMEEGVDSRRVGFISSGAPARQHSKILTEDGEEVSLPLFTLQLGIIELHRSARHVGLRKCSHY